MPVTEILHETSQLGKIAPQSTKMSLRYYSQHGKPNAQKVKATSLGQSLHELHTGEPTPNSSQLTVQGLFDDYVVTIESEANKFMPNLLCIVSWREKRGTHTHNTTPSLPQ